MTADGYSKTAISLGALKDALLYFNYVVPVVAPVEIAISYRRVGKRLSGQEFAHEVTSVLEKIIEEVLPVELKNSEFIEQLLRLHVLTVNAMRSFKEQPSGQENAEFQAYLKVFAKNYRLYRLPVCTFPESIGAGNEFDDMAISIASLRLIHTETVSYEQLLELRKDPEAKEKLRRLRLFAYQNYQNKPRSFIEDDIMARISDYEAAVKKFGFETKAAVMTSLLDSKLVAGGIAGSFLSAYMNQPLLAIGAAAGAAGIAIGKIAVEVGRKRFELQKVMAESPVSYISYAKDKLTEKNK